MFRINHLGCQEAESSGFGFGAVLGVGTHRGDSHGDPQQGWEVVASLLTLEQRGCGG